MPTTPNAGLPYPTGDDEPNGAAQIEALARALDALPGVVMDAVRLNVTADANGNASVLHGLGQTPDFYLFDVSAPAAGNLLVSDVKVRAATSTGVTVRVFRPDGTPFAGNVTVFGVLGRVTPTVTALPSPAGGAS
jgi:hypothetical protein